MLFICTLHLINYNMDTKEVLELAVTALSLDLSPLTPSTVG